MTLRISYETALKTLTELVNDKGRDYVYAPLDGGIEGNGCVYAHDGKPSCGVGEVVYRLDPDAFKRLEAVEAEAAKSGGDTGLESLYPAYDIELDIELEPRAHTLLNVFQFNQDRSKPYGQSLDMAIEAAHYE